MKKIPFKIDRNARENLPEQLANGFRQAILSGYYKPGERLPSFEQMVAELDVSIRAPRDAMKILQDANLVRSRPRIGCEVLARDERIWKGLVVVAVNAAYEGSYYISVLIGAIRKAMVSAGYSFRSVTVDAGPRGRPDFSQLDAVLSGPLSYVIAVYPDNRLVKRILKSGKPALAYVDVQSGGVSAAPVCTPTFAPQGAFTFAADGSVTPERALTSLTFVSRDSDGVEIARSVVAGPIIGNAYAVSLGNAVSVDVLVDETVETAEQDFGPVVVSCAGEALYRVVDRKRYELMLPADATVTFAAETGAVTATYYDANGEVIGSRELVGAIKAGVPLPVPLEGARYAVLRVSTPKPGLLLFVR